ncbi:tetratricopeptide repeat protein [Ramlibacter albus]|uniref:Sel1 repeat family protein n=1 Tax=Ramlibacter albus TaxID=2079448 RepID=A0A923S148_9BURK|nr:SEL1-like repeat protein [Ramlibacter albus]MBC5764044.1 sel1 repeat family protein [Ramlibacter albus]
MKLRSSLSTTRCVAAVAMLCAIAAGANAGPAEDLREAEAAAGAGDVHTAMSLLRKAADKNHPVAQARLAELLHAAEFDAEALDLYKRSAAQGEAAGEFGMGVMYANGAAVKRDDALALDWYRKAEKKNYPPALDAIARAYRTGTLGLPKDLALANELEARRKSLLAAAKK